MNKEQLKERKKEMFTIIGYSIQRIDLLIISISGAGVLLCLETLKFMYTNKLAIHWSIKGSAAIFLLAIIVNFISQFLALKSSEYDYDACHKELSDDFTESDRNKIRKLEVISELYGKYVNFTNIASGFLMLLGLFVCFLYFVMTY